MIQITPHIRILMAVEPQDFRKGIDGLARVCREVLKSDPFSGYMFVFHNKRRTSVKILIYDGQGFWIMMKRLSEGKFFRWPHLQETQVCSLAAHELQVFLANGDPSLLKGIKIWKRIGNGS